MHLDDVSLAIDPTAQTVLAVVLGFIMFGIGLGLVPDDFRRVARRPGIVLYGAGLQLLALPALTWVLSRMLAPTPSIALGMVIVAACPGGSMSNLLTVIARGDVALSVSLTALSSVSAAVLTPVGILLWGSLAPDTAAILSDVAIDRGRMLVQTALVLALPLAVGMFLAARTPRLARRLHKPCHRVSLLALVVFIAGALVGNRGHLDVFVVVIMPVVVVHNALALALGYLGARAARLPGPARRTFAFEIGIQNAGLGLVIILSQLPGLGGAALTVAGWGVWHLISGALLATIWSRRPPGRGGAAASLTSPQTAQESP
ncbi:bile acid:sodium symporter family protein [Haliangium sp.]|uniref:bile acid:sodium symporter family protein n=1 Tax=Haliangium sp. TaxID=2663208 RepID=UPI003D0BE306